MGHKKIKKLFKSQSTIIQRISQVAGVFDLFEFSRAFSVFGFSDLSSKEIKTNAAAISALFQRLPEKENRFRDVVKNFR